jgi:LysW-gamma-L-lysine carboxypeptidase
LEKTLKVFETFRVSVDRVGYPVPAWECEKNSSLVRAFLKGIRLEGGTPRFVYKTGTADLNVVAPIWKCPAVVYGPGDSSLDHTPNEHISMDEYGRAVKVLANTLRTLARPKLPLDVSQPPS